MHMKVFLRLTRTVLLLLVGVLGLHLGTGSIHAQEEIVNSQIDNDPHIPVGRQIKVFSERLLPLWLEALGRPEHDLKRQAAAAIALAHQKGMTGLETCVPALLKTLDQPDQQPAVRLAIAQALIELDAREAADALFGHAQKDGVDTRNLVEPVLARWNYAPMRALWLERLNQPGLASRSWILAIQGLAAVREIKVVPRLHELLTATDTDPIVRVEAAKALGDLQTKGLERAAESLAVGKAGPGNFSQLAAAYLLRHHQGPDAAKILSRLATQAEPVTALVALQGLLGDDARRVVPLIPQLTASPDAGVRSDAIEAFRRYPAMNLVVKIADLMNDAHPMVRHAARRALAEVAKQKEFRDPVLNAAARILDGNRWREIEQAIILTVNLDHTPIAPRLVKLLQFDRPEVFVTAAWGLRKLAVAQTLPDQLREIERRWEKWGQGGMNPLRDAMDAELAQLCESVGQARYAPAAPALVRFIPRIVLRRFGAQSRIAAIWSLGILQEKNPPADVVAQLVERLEDAQTIDPEDTGVRRMCAITLGRMRAKEAIDGLRMNNPMRLSTSSFSSACAWAMEQITGEKQEIAPLERTYYLGWFLEPNR
jgi:HEAT repeat protein